MKTTKMQDVKLNYPADEVEEILEDRSSTGRKRPWEEFKVDNELLALSYESLGMTKKPIVFGIVLRPFLSRMMPMLRKKL